jgi:Phosphotransferase enzyme family
VNGLGWLSEYSEPALRSALRVAGAGLDRLPIELTGTNDLSRPTWRSTSPKLPRPVPTPRAWPPESLRVGCRSPTTFVRASTPEQVDALAAELARFLANSHAPQILALARERLDDPLRTPEPGLQATTNALKLRFTPMIDARQRARVHRWCDWVDERLAAAAEPVFVHGDFHPYNQLWDSQELRLLLVADFETSGLAEPEYDFRVIPSFGPGVDLLTSTVDEYVALTGRRISLERVMALHVCTTLGDALWRSESGLPLLLPRPGGGTPNDCVDELAARLALLGIET